MSDGAASVPRVRMRSLVARLIGRSASTVEGAVSPKIRREGLDVEIRSARRTAPSGELAVVLILRNEGRYLHEWLEFQRLVGVEHVFAYDNASTDDSWDVLKAYEAAGFVTPVPWDLPYRLEPRRGAVQLDAQKLAYAHAVATYGRGWRRMSFLDADEFLFPVSGDDLRTVLMDYRDLPGLAVFWSMFGSSGHESAPSGLVIENYTMRAPFPLGTHMKSIVDPRKVARVDSAHQLLAQMFDEQRRPVEGFRKSDHRRANKPPPDYLPTSDVFRLHHYSTKSRSELRAKVERRQSRSGKALALADLVDNAAVIEDVSALRFVARIRSALVPLR